MIPQIIFFLFANIWFMFTIFLATFIFGIICTIWLFKPYFIWKKQMSKRKSEQIIIKEGTSVFKYEDYKIVSPKGITLSVVIPAYNEEHRLPKMLYETIEYLENQQILYEIIVVNDASSDKTSQAALKHTRYTKNGQIQKNIDIKVIEYEQNRGKGGAIRLGMLIAQGETILFVDADGATKFSDYANLDKELHTIVNQNGQGFVVGSRKLDTDINNIQRTLLRSILGWGFHFLIDKICNVKVKDTQCGFKLFTKNTAQILFETLHLERWAFDVELFIIANNRNIPVKEVPVNWTEIEGSKLNVFWDSLNMLRDFLLVRILYLLKIWKFTDKIISKNE